MSFAFRVTRSRWWMNGEAFAILNPRSFVGIFLDYGCENTEKSASLTDSGVWTFLEGEENQNMERKAESYIFSGSGNGISRDWEGKSTTGRFATGQFWPCSCFFCRKGKSQYLRILHIENYAHCFCHDSTHFSALAPTHFMILCGDYRSFYFHSLVKSTFLSVSSGSFSQWTCD